MPFPIEMSTLPLEDPHRLSARDVPQILLRLRVHIQPLEHLSHLLRQIGNGRAADVEHIVGRPVEQTGDLREPRSPSGIEQVDRQPELLTHEFHQIAGRRHRTELGLEVGLDAPQLVSGRIGIELAIASLVVGQIDRRKLLELRGEELLLDRVVPIGRASTLIGR